MHCPALMLVHIRRSADTAIGNNKASPKAKQGKERNERRKEDQVQKNPQSKKVEVLLGMGEGGGGSRIGMCMHMMEWVP